jgi:hypothetical protein
MTSTPKPRNARNICLGVSLGVVCGVHQDFIEDFVQRRDLEPKKGGNVGPLDLKKHGNSYPLVNIEKTMENHHV